MCPRIRASRLLLVHRLRGLPRVRRVLVSAADTTAVLALVAALCGGIWLLLTRSTDRRIDEERQREAERRFYDQRIRDMEDDQ